MALPDGGTDRAPEIALPERHLAAVFKDAIAEHGPRVRRETLADLAVAFATLSDFFAGAMVLLHACSGPGGRRRGVASWAPAVAALLDARNRVGLQFLGAWLSAAQQLNSGDAGVLDGVCAEPFDSWIRGCVLLGVGVIVILLPHKQVVVLNLGGEGSGLSSVGILDGFSATAICGALLGLGERILPRVISGEADRVLRQFGADRAAPAPAPAPAGGAPAAVAPP
ncbi:hypothetical protein [Roseomonas fluvialis]|nr:hypothetical protein [Roseomonas fluvialis]